MGRIWRLYESAIHLGSLRVKGGERAMVMRGMGIRVESRMPSSQIGAIIMKEQAGRERERARARTYGASESRNDLREGDS